MKTFLALIIGIAIGVGAFWYYKKTHSQSDFDQIEQKIKGAVSSVSGTIQDKLHSLNLSSSNITQELERTGRVIRDKSRQAGQAIADATADARTTAAIKAKLVADPDLSALRISVNTTDGVVTLSGTVSSTDHIGKAIVLAMDTDHVRQVISTIQVKSK